MADKSNFMAMRKYKNYFKYMNCIFYNLKRDIFSISTFHMRSNINIFLSFSKWWGLMREIKRWKSLLGHLILTAASTGFSFTYFSVLPIYTELLMQQGFHCLLMRGFSTASYILSSENIFLDLVWNWNKLGHDS